MNRNFGPLISRRGVLGVGAGLAASVVGMPYLRAQPTTVQIGLATRTWFPSVVAQTAVDQELFEKEGLNAELTVYQSGGEAFNAVAAGAADVISSGPAQVAIGREQDVPSRIVGNLCNGFFGWKLIVPVDSDIEDVGELAGANVGITSAGSATDALAQWAMAEFGIEFNNVPVGGAGLVPNLLSGNVAAAVLYSPLSFQVEQEGDGRAILDFGTAIPEHLVAGWVASEQYIEANPDVLQRTMNALYGGLVYLQDNRDDAVRIIAEVNGIPEGVAEQEYQEVFLNLVADGAMNVDLADRALEILRLAGFTGYDQPEMIFTTDFPPVPTQA